MNRPGKNAAAKDGTLDRETAAGSGPGGEAPEPASAPAAALRRILLYGGAALLAVLGVVEAGLQIIGHDDLWWNLASGRQITESLEVPRVDVFSHTAAGRPWINLEWLSHVLFYNVYRHLGEDAIVYLRLGLIFLVFAAAFGLCWARSRSFIVSLLAVAAGASVCRPFLDARPQLFTFVFSLLVLWILHLFRRRGRRRLLWWIPAVLVLWTQLHGGYIFGLLLVAGNLLTESGKRLLGLPADPVSWRDLRTLAWVTLASAAAIVVNPWTFEAYTHPLAMSKLFGGSVYLTVNEWLPPGFYHRPEAFNPGQFWPYLLLVGLLVLPIAVVRWRSFDCNDVGLAAVLAVFFALQHRRFIPLFVILTLPLLSWAVRFWADRWPRPRRAAAAVAVGAWLLFVALLPLRLRYLQAAYAGSTLFRANIQYAYFPERAVRFLRQVRVSGLMFNLYNWGGYLEFFLPESRTFIDGRAQTAFDEDLYLAYLAVHFGQPGWEEILDRHGVTWALLHAGSNAALLDAMDRDPGWTQIFAADASAVLVAEGSQNRELLARFRARELPLPEIGETYRLYGRQAEDAGDFERAAEDFARACELSPGDGEARGRLLLALAAAGRTAEARQQAQRAREELPDSARVRLAIAGLEQETGRGEAAYRIFEEVFRRWPDRLEAVDGMLGIDFQRGRAAIEQIYRSDPRRPWASYAMGRAAELGEDFERARRFYWAEGRDAYRAGDRDRIWRSRQAMERAASRLGPPPREPATDPRPPGDEGD